MNITPIETKCRHGYYVSYVCPHCAEAKAQAVEIDRLTAELAIERAKVKAYKDAVDKEYKAHQNDIHANGRLVCLHIIDRFSALSSPPVEQGSPEHDELMESGHA